MNYYLKSVPSSIPLILLMGIFWQVPNDEVAATEAIRGAQNVAQGWHNALQNEQLLVGGVLLATQ